MAIRNFLLAIVTAPEILVFLIVFAALFYYPQPFSFLGGKLAGELESWKYITALPTALFAWSVKAFSDIRSPSDKQENRLLYEWPLYKLLVARLYLALVFAGLAATTSVCLWLMGKHLEHRFIGSIFVGAIGVSVVVAASLTFARAKVKELLTQYGPQT